MSLSSATFRVILERLFSSQTVYAPWVLEVLLQMGDQNLENTGTCNCSSECVYMIVQLCVLEISRKWNFYYWRNEFLKIQYSSEVDGQRTCKTLSALFNAVSLLFSALFRSFLFQNAAAKTSNQHFQISTIKGCNGCRFNQTLKWLFMIPLIFRIICLRVFKMWTINLMHFFSGWCKIPTWDRESFVLRI